MPVTDNRTLVITIVNPVTIATATLPPGATGIAYSVQLVNSGGVGPFAWAASGLPAGLSCSPSGLISGNPTAVGTANVAVSVTDNGML